MCSIRTSLLALTLAGTSFARPGFFRPPAVPLVAHDPYFSVWSMADHLTDENTTLDRHRVAAWVADSDRREGISSDGAGSQVGVVEKQKLPLPYWFPTWHVNIILRRLDVDDRTQAVVVPAQRGIVEI